MARHYSGSRCDLEEGVQGRAKGVNRLDPDIHRIFIFGYSDIE